MNKAQTHRGRGGGYYTTPFDMKGCFCLFTKCQIHPLISKGTTCRRHIFFVNSHHEVTSKKWHNTTVCMLHEWLQLYSNHPSLYGIISHKCKNNSTVSPRINVHALIFEDALSFRKHVHALIFEHKKYCKKNTCTYIRTWNDLDNKQMINILT